MRLVAKLVGEEQAAGVYGASFYSKISSRDRTWGPGIKEDSDKYLTEVGRIAERD